MPAYRPVHKARGRNDDQGRDMELSVRSAFVGLAVVGLQALAPGVRAEPASEAALGACFEAQARAAPFSGVVLATQGDSRFYRTAGNVSGATPPTADTPYRLASVGKLFTQVAIGQLIDQRKVDLQAPVGTYVAGLPPEIAAVTIDRRAECDVRSSKPGRDAAGQVGARSAAAGGQSAAGVPAGLEDRILQWRLLSAGRGDRAGQRPHL
jgi:hypothetical protein